MTHGQVPSPMGLHLESPPGPHGCPVVSEVLLCGGPARPQSSSHRTGFRSISWSCFLSGRLRSSTFLFITQIRRKPLPKVPLPVAGDPQVDTGFEGGTRPGGQGMRGVKCLIGGSLCPPFPVCHPVPPCLRKGCWSLLLYPALHRTAVHSRFYIRLLVRLHPRKCYLSCRNQSPPNKHLNVVKMVNPLYILP